MIANRKTGGTGLGLSIAARAVHLHHGTIKASNASAGGLMVEIRLPIKQDSDSLSHWKRLGCRPGQAIERSLSSCRAAYPDPRYEARFLSHFSVVDSFQRPARLRDNWRVNPYGRTRL